MHWYMNRNKVPKTMPKKEMEALLSGLKELRSSATFESANFFVFDEDSDAKMKEVREVTRIYRQSWLIEPLDRLIKRYSKPEEE